MLFEWGKEGEMIIARLYNFKCEQGKNTPKVSGLLLSRAASVRLHRHHRAVQSDLFLLLDRRCTENLSLQDECGHLLQFFLATLELGV